MSVCACLSAQLYGVCVLSTFLPMFLRIVYHTPQYSGVSGGRKGGYGFTNKLSSCISHCFGINLIGESLAFDHIDLKSLTFVL